MPAQPVTTRLLTPTDEVIEDPQMLYRPVVQPDGPPPLTLRTLMVSPEQATAWLKRADTDPDFRNRPVRLRDVQRWRLLMETGRFAFWLPDGPILFDGDQKKTGILLNGRHRLTALAGHDGPVGLTVINNVPRTMMPFFDTGRSRTLRDLFAITGRMSNAQIGAVGRLGLRYEEFLTGLRSPLGWKRWSQCRDEFTDIDGFLARRESLTDLFEAANKAYRGCRLVITSLMVFRFYQSLAWPEGERDLKTFWDGLSEGAMLASGSPALALREYGRTTFESKLKVPAKREAFLMLLFKFFGSAVGGSRIHAVRFGYGQPMLAPYHPDGPTVAAERVRAALQALDGECDQQQQRPAVT